MKNITEAPEILFQEYNYINKNTFISAIGLYLFIFTLMFLMSLILLSIFVINSVSLIVIFIFFLFLFLLLLMIDEEDKKELFLKKILLKIKFYRYKIKTIEEKERRDFEEKQADVFIKFINDGKYTKWMKEFNKVLKMEASLLKTFLTEEYFFTKENKKRLTSIFWKYQHLF